MWEPLLTGMFLGATVGFVIAGSMPVGWDARRLKALPFLAVAIFGLLLLALGTHYVTSKAISSPPSPSSPEARMENPSYRGLFFSGAVVGFVSWPLLIGYVLGRRFDAESRACAEAQRRAEVAELDVNSRNFAPPPAALHAFILAHQAARAPAAPPRQSRWMLPTVPRRSSEDHFAMANQFSECDVAQATCGGEFIRGWFYNESFVTATWDDDIVINAHDDALISRTIPTYAFDFALTPDHRACVIIQTALDNRRRRAAYHLPEGLESARLGDLLAEFIEDTPAPPVWPPRGWRARATTQAL